MTNAWQMNIAATDFNCANVTAEQDWARMNVTWDGNEPCPNPVPRGVRNRYGCGKDSRKYSCASYPVYSPPPPSASPTRPSRADGMVGYLAGALNSVFVVSAGVAMFLLLS